MLQFAVCDDQVSELKLLGKLLEYYQKRKSCSLFQTDFYSSSVDLMQRLSNGVSYDFFILDMMMPGYSGVEVGRKIRMQGRDSVIIYVTASPDFALDAIGVHPEQYLLKPIYPEDLFQALNNAMARFNVDEELFFSITTKDGLERLPYSEIVCIEHAERVVKVFMRDGRVHESIYLRGSFQKLIEPALCQPGFLQTHQSYLVNLRYARSLQRGALWMSIGMRIPVSRRNAACVRWNYQRYAMRQEKP